MLLKLTQFPHRRAFHSEVFLTFSLDTIIHVRPYSHVEVKGVILGDNVELSPAPKSCSMELELYFYHLLALWS